ncbi:adenylyl-sulfate kinase [Sedimenticola hydrogenitrophicus]|uniref:adenylyl-sulfate kinase n=1 Tax=Sedimenticola hydrogenitrophicus TaxID=2967975 RepID=UPI0021A80099|nr:adenylyl-sulfate kinase [Sedimenticola hydrogenitrophicus]
MSDKKAGKSTNIVWHNATITRELREKQNGHKGAVLWFTGLSGSGKSTLAHAVEDRLYHMGSRTFVLDGDNVRHGLCSDLGFSDADRTENIRRIGELAKLFLESGSVVLTAFISPFQADREIARNVTPHGDFYEIFCDASLDVCEKRDVKGLYAKARAGEIPHFTGISSPYEAPQSPELVVDTGEQSLEKCVDQVIELLAQRGVVETYKGPAAVA